MKLIYSLFFLFLVSCNYNDTNKFFLIKPVPFTDVKITEGFWNDIIETNRRVTIPYAFKKCEETGRISNFAKAGGLEPGPFQGRRYDDSDVYKVIEGASYSLSNSYDSSLDEYLDDLIYQIAAAQEDDGYLFTCRTINPDSLPSNSGIERWSYLNHSHELYNVGHLYEAAVAHYEATRKRSLLDVAIKNANLIDEVFGPGKNMGVPGHEEIEIGLIKLYKVTGNKKYFNLAKFFIDQRGNERGHELYGEYAQDHKPVIEQNEAVGHAVRAGYLYSAIADIAAICGEKTYIQAIDTIWDNIVNKKMYITGGIGARRDGEAFGDNYELPNATAYNETCAAIAFMFFNHRLFLLHGDGKYMDVFERVLYNGFLSGVSMKGNSFFYPNPLEFDGEFPFNQGSTCRSGWFDCSCCPVNIVRFLPSLSGFVYATKDYELFVNLFISGKSKIDLAGQIIEVKQKTNYPNEGTVVFTIDPQSDVEFDLKIRIPAWATGRPVPSGDLYSYLDHTKNDIGLFINDKKCDFEIIDGYAVLSRNWKRNDVVELNLNMPVQKVLTDKLVKADSMRLAFERGPLVFCAEGIDNQQNVLNLLIEKNSRIDYEFDKDLLNGLTVLTGRAKVFDPEKKDIKKWKEIPFKAVPYYAWAHRGISEMAVWLKYY